MRTVMTAASCDDNPLDGGFTHETRLALASVDLMFQLEESCLPLGVDVVIDRRTARFDGLTQHRQQAGMQLLQLGPCQRRCSPLRPDFGPEQRLVGIDVPNSAE